MSCLESPCHMDTILSHGYYLVTWILSCHMDTICVIFCKKKVIKVILGEFYKTKIQSGINTYDND